MIQSIMWLALITGSLFNTYESNQSLVDNNTGVVFSDFGTWCSDWKLIAGHNYLPLGKRIRLLWIWDKVSVGECVYTVKDRKVVERKKTKVSQLIQSWTITLQTCRTNSAEYILLITLSND